MNKRTDLTINKVVSIKSGSSKKSVSSVADDSKKSAPRIIASPFVFARVSNVVYPQEFLPGGDELVLRWARQIDAAMEAWGKLGKAELIETGGHAHNLARLVEERYDITRDESEALVRIFFAKHNFQSSDW